MASGGAWLDRPELAEVWAALHRRLERTGRLPQGRIQVRPASREQRHALADLLGGPVLSDRVTVDLAALDLRIAERSPYASLVEVVEALTGRPVRNRPADRAADARRRQNPVDLARSLLDTPWRETWISGLVRSGAVARCPDPESLVRDAVTVLRALLDGAEGSRVELAARFLGDAHALDEDTELHNVVLRGLAAAAGGDLPTGLTERRALWQRYGVSADLVSATCLTLGLRPNGAGGPARRLQLAADEGDPVHLTAWDLRRTADAAVTPDPVLVCENPRVLEAAAERYGGAVRVVCTSGQPGTVALAVLAWLRGSGCALRYHGDFDWPGIAIANRLTAQCGVTPWLMNATDYEASMGSGSLPLTGKPVVPAWDAELGAAMRSHGVAVHEEAVLPRLLEVLPNLS